MKALLREPLFHFAVLGGAIFVLFSMFGDAPDSSPAKRIEVSDMQLDIIARQFQATWRRAPTDDEMSALIDRHIEDEVLVREARTLGLDRDDAIVRQRLAMKIRFLLEAGANALEPTDEELATHLAAHPDDFIRPARISFEQILLSGADESPEAVLSALRGGAEAAALNRTTLLPTQMESATPRIVDSTFGNGFFEQLDSVPNEEWSGPVKSGFGMHLVRVTDRVPASLPPLAEVREGVLVDWRAQKARDAAASGIDALKSQYVIQRPDQDTVTVTQ